MRNFLNLPESPASIFTFHFTLFAIYSAIGFISMGLIRALQFSQSSVEEFGIVFMIGVAYLLLIWIPHSLYLLVAAIARLIQKKPSIAGSYFLAACAIAIIGFGVCAGMNSGFFGFGAF